MSTELQELLPPLDLSPRTAPIPAEQWSLQPIETRTHRPAYRPPQRAAGKPRRQPIRVHPIAAAVVLLCASYAGLRHHGLDFDCGRVGDAVQCRMVERPAPWSDGEGSP